MRTREAPHQTGGELSKDDPKVSGGDIEEATPDPIPNSEVKLFGADGTAREAVWESRTLPGLFRRLKRVTALEPFLFWAAGGAPKLRRYSVALPLGRVIFKRLVVAKRS